MATAHNPPVTRRIPIIAVVGLVRFAGMLLVLLLDRNPQATAEGLARGIQALQG